MKEKQWQPVKEPKGVRLLKALAELGAEMNKAILLDKIRKAKNLTEHMTGRKIDLNGKA